MTCMRFDSSLFLIWFILEGFRGSGIKQKKGATFAEGRDHRIPAEKPGSVLHAAVQRCNTLWHHTLPTHRWKADTHFLLRLTHCRWSNCHLSRDDKYHFKRVCLCVRLYCLLTSCCHYEYQTFQTPSVVPASIFFLLKLIELVLQKRKCVCGVTFYEECVLFGIKSKDGVAVCGHQVSWGKNKEAQCSFVDDVLEEHLSISLHHKWLVTTRKNNKTTYCNFCRNYFLYKEL